VIKKQLGEEKPVVVIIWSVYCVLIVLVSEMLLKTLWIKPEFNYARFRYRHVIETCKPTAHLLRVV
jgi:hypothetical protein